MATAQYWMAKKKVTFNLPDVKKMAKDKFSLIIRASKHLQQINKVLFTEWTCDGQYSLIFLLSMSNNLILIKTRMLMINVEHFCYHCTMKKCCSEVKTQTCVFRQTGEILYAHSLTSSACYHPHPSIISRCKQATSAHGWHNSTNRLQVVTKILSIMAGDAWKYTISP